jgi:hypothetical protein
LADGSAARAGNTTTKASKTRFMAMLLLSGAISHKPRTVANAIARN